MRRRLINCLVLILSIILCSPSTFAEPVHGNEPVVSSTANVCPKDANNTNDSTPAKIITEPDDVLSISMLTQFFILWMNRLVFIALLFVNLMMSLKLFKNREKSVDYMRFLVLIWLVPFLGAWIAKDLLVSMKPAQKPHSLSNNIHHNPFWVLEIKFDASRAEAERAGQRLLALLEIGSESARRFTTPLGIGERTTDTVRLALSELRDPVERIAHELWNILPYENCAMLDESPVWENMEQALGWKCRFSNKVS